MPRRVEGALTTVLLTPGTHRVHHAPERPLTDSNFGLVFSVWDRMLGTFSAPNPAQVTGLDTVDLGLLPGPAREALDRGDTSDEALLTAVRGVVQAEVERGG